MLKGMCKSKFYMVWCVCVCVWARVVVVCCNLTACSVFSIYRLLLFVVLFVIHKFDGFPFIVSKRKDGMDFR